MFLIFDDLTIFLKIQFLFRSLIQGVDESLKSHLHSGIYHRDFYSCVWWRTKWLRVTRSALYFSIASCGRIVRGSGINKGWKNSANGRVSSRAITWVVNFDAGDIRGKLQDLCYARAYHGFQWICEKGRKQKVTRLSFLI